jgi:8-oxo-dGTP pyrophosphatase MutT (NUDIX family)
VLPEAEQRKVTVFCTRGAGAAAELLVFRHPTAGIQVPSGTVEEEEAFEAAALRELEEETGLRNARIVRLLAKRPYQLPDGQAVLLGEVELRTRPAPDAAGTGWALKNVGVRVLEERDGFLRVDYEEHDLNQPSFLIARLHGWLPRSALAFRQRRAFFHAVPTEPTRDRWQHFTDADGFTSCEPYWTPLRPRPSLVEGQDEWLDACYNALLESVSST